ncbi:Uncharacterised protein [Escherichia coli]|uniref:Uncharacterized protein n=1 Tax=Escherichia coli TaxID=562 RepID=A0A376THJ7_ECOLX|nr:Uncharacterised protein [Escherichia coli]
MVPMAGCAQSLVHVDGEAIGTGMSILVMWYKAGKMNLAACAVKISLLAACCSSMKQRDWMLVLSPPV